MEISLIIYPDIKSCKVKWPVVPRVNETVAYKEKMYTVTQVWHSMDLKEIKVFMVTKP